MGQKGKSVPNYILTDLLMFLYSGFSTEGEGENVLLVGPIEPMVVGKEVSAELAKKACKDVELETGSTAWNSISEI